jgi:hypothetical protein
MSDSEFTRKARQFAQSILAGVQELEDLSAEPADDDGVLKALDAVDTEVWSTIDYIKDGRPDS